MHNTNDKIKIENLIMDIRDALQDVLVAQIRKSGTELDMEFINGQRFTLALFENAQKNPSKRLAFLKKRRYNIFITEFSLGRGVIPHRQ